ncbi:hypothetical protein FHX69_6732 [Prauserella muralis]|nr:hypothetical protein FHX69_6732 [Prauserella muralis]
MVHRRGRCAPEAKDPRCRVRTTDLNAELAGPSAELAGLSAGLAGLSAGLAGLSAGLAGQPRPTAATMSGISSMISTAPATSNTEPERIIFVIGTAPEP